MYGIFIVRYSTTVWHAVVNGGIQGISNFKPNAKKMSAITFFVFLPNS